MNCPKCNKDASKTFNQLGRVKTCGFCGCKFKIGFKVKEIVVYVMIVSIVAGIIAAVLDNSNLTIVVIACSFLFVFKHIYKIELVE